eukprot:gene15494-15639_t
MKFGPVPVEMAAGSIVAHAIRHETLTLKKGELVRLEHIELLKAAGFHDIVVAQLNADDVNEDLAASELARHLAGSHVRLEKPFTGRVNFFAEMAGVLTIDVAGVDRVNMVDDAITFATLPAFKAVQAGEMIATVKIIPFAVARSLLDLAKQVPPLIAVAPFKPMRVGVVSTLLPGLKASVIAKTLAVMQRRLDPAGAVIVEERRVPHQEAAVSAAIAELAALCEMVIVFGASAITDRRDVIPAALELCGGRVEHFGMPVDPGNLLLLGALGSVPVIGAPGCARSPKENGFDWVLQRLLAGLAVTAQDIRRMGTGGLLMEIISRPQPRLGDHS